MSQDLDFERYWLNKLAGCLEAAAGEQVRRAVMAGSEGLSDATPREDVVAWSQGAMDRLDGLVDQGAARAILAGCACQYPKEALQDVREVYEATGDLDRVHGMLQARFESLLADTLQLEPGIVEEVVRRGWGLAGVRQGERTIIATKIPKSGFLVEYLNETDPELRRQYYCHCPRVRDALKSGQRLSATYCYCGAGYYKGIWEEILQQPVEVELLESVLQGDEVCKIAVHLPVT
jgi:hypothetical protein